MESVSEVFRENLRRLMQLQGITQAELAKKAGTSEPAISRILSGRDGVTLARGERIAAALSVPFSKLVTVYSPPKPKEKNLSTVS